MFKPQNKIIIVDDDDRDLMTLSKVFLNSGIGCKTIKYDQMYDSPLVGVRIAFFDINLTNKAIDLTSGNTVNYKTDRDISAVFNDLATAIKSIIHKENGPYALIFWSSNIQFKDNFIEYINDKARGYSNMSAPIIIKGIEKSQFMTDVENIDGIQAEIEKIIKGSSVELLFDFENKATFAATETINEIYKIIPKSNVWGGNTIFETNFNKIFSKIAISTLGYEYAKENPDKAITEALLPIHNHLMVKSRVISNEWRIFLTELKSKGVKYPKNFDETTLNSIFHLEKAVTNKDTRGAIIEINFKKRGVLSSFRIPDYEKWIKKNIPFKAGYESEHTQIISESRLVAIELSASCDFSNKKERINKYVLGILTPKIDVDKYLNKNARGDSSYHVGGCTFNYEGKVFQIWLNLNFVFGATPEDKRLGDVQFIFKKEIMDMIGNRYANHVSRIGITSF